MKLVDDPEASADGTKAQPTYFADGGVFDQIYQSNQ